MRAKNVGSLAEEEAEIVEASNDDDEEAKEPGQDSTKKDSNLGLVVELKAEIARLKS